MMKRELIALLSEWDDNTEVVYRTVITNDLNDNAEEIVEHEILDVALSTEGDKIVLCVDREMIDLL